MSFILDALKKSEAERRRQTGPTIYEMRAAPRRTGLPTWVLVLIAALALNLLVLGYLLIRKPAAPTAPAPTTAAVPVSPTPAATTEPTPSPTQGPYRAPAQAPLPETAAASPDTAPAAPRVGPVASLPAPRPADGGAVASLADMRGSGGSLPDLRLSLHVYDADPTHRYLLLNGMRLREGDVMPDGLRVERISEDGAIMGWRGRRFLLPRGD